MSGDKSAPASDNPERLSHANGILYVRLSHSRHGEPIWTTREVAREQAAAIRAAARLVLSPLIGEAPWAFHRRLVAHLESFADDVEAMYDEATTD